MIKKVFLLRTTIWNGTIPMKTMFSIFKTRDLAEKTKIAVDEANYSEEQQFGSVETRIEEVDFYETEKDVPILNKAQ